MIILGILHQNATKYIPSYKASLCNVPSIHTERLSLAKYCSCEAGKDFTGNSGTLNVEFCAVENVKHLSLVKSTDHLEKPDQCLPLSVSFLRRQKVVLSYIWLTLRTLVNSSPNADNSA